MPDTPNARRRALLLRLGLASSLAYTAPLMLALSKAKASDSISAPTRPSPPSRPSAPSLPSPQRSVVAPAAPPELVVALSARADFALLEAEGFALFGAERVALLDIWIARFGLPPGLTLTEAQARAAALLPLARVEENTLYRTSELLCSGDECGAFSMIGWPQPEPCPATPLIGMIDAGINPDHDAFSGQALDIVPLDLGARPPAGATHGTAVAALLVGRAGSRTPGLLPDATLVAVEAFHADAQGEAADVYALLRGLDVLAERGVGVINLSLAGPPNPLLADAIAALFEQGIAVVAAAGNGGPRAEPQFPAAYEDVLAITAVDSAASIYRHAGAGDHIGFAAPGVQLWTAASVSGGRLRSGTSYAAPFATAALAALRDAEPELSISDAIAALQGRAQDLGAEGFDPVFGWGLVRAEGICLVPA